MENIKKQIELTISELFVKHYGKKSIDLKNTACDRWSSEAGLYFYGIDEKGEFLSITEVDKRSIFKMALTSPYSDVESVIAIVDYPTIIDILICSINKDLKGLTALHQQLNKKENENNLVEHIENNCS